MPFISVLFHFLCKNSLHHFQKRATFVFPSLGTLMELWRSHAEFHIFFAVQGHVKIKTTCRRAKSSSDEADKHLNVDGPTWPLSFHTGQNSNENVLVYNQNWWDKDFLKHCYGSFALLFLARKLLSLAIAKLKTFLSHSIVTEWNYLKLISIESCG